MPAPTLPPLPTPPAALSKKPAPQRTQEQLRALWEERIKILAESTNRRKQLAEVEEDIARTRNLVDSAYYPTLSEDDKSRVSDELAALDRKREEIKKQREDALNHLIKADSWPATTLTDAEDKELDKYHEMIKNVAQLKEQVESINTLFLKIRDGKDSDPDAMDVDPQEGSSSRPLKRRRGAESEAVPANEPGPTKEQLETIQLKITELETTYSNFSNDLVVRDEELRQRIDTEVESYLDNASLQGEEVYHKVAAEIKQTGDEVGTVAEELASLILDADDQKKKLEAVKARIAESQAQFKEMQTKFHKLEEERQKDRKTIAALEAAVKTYTDAPPPQPSVPGLTQDQIIHLMDEPLLDIVRAHIRPLLEQLRNKVQDMLNTQNSEMYRALWGKLSLTLRMVETISKRLERIDQASGSGSGSGSNTGSAAPNVA